MSVPGPNARQFWELPPHVEFEKSQSIPVSLHLGPLIFGDTSPEFDEANAATNGPCSDIYDLSIGSTETKYIKLNTKTQNIFCCLNENLTTFLYTLTGGTRKQKEKKSFLF